MYLLTIRDGLVTRHIGSPSPAPSMRADDLDRRLAGFGERCELADPRTGSPESAA